MTNSRRPSIGRCKRVKQRGEMSKRPASGMNYSQQCPLKAVQRTGCLAENDEGRKHQEIKL